MKERPILFSSVMVRAILAGTKTVTRRIVNPQPEMSEDGPFRAGKVQYSRWQWPAHAARSMVGVEEMAAFSPYGTRGDRLWVKETHQIVPLHEGIACVYRASCDGDSFDCVDEDGCIQRLKVEQWKPSIFMRREYSRITLEVASVRVERLSIIDEADAKREGVEPFRHPSGKYISYRDGFARLWDEINGKRIPFDESPWVWRVEFKRVERSITTAEVKAALATGTKERKAAERTLKRSPRR